MSQKKNEIKLTDVERKELESIVKTGKHTAREIRRAHSLLLADGGKTDGQIAQLLHVTEQTVVRTRRNWVASNHLKDKPKAPRKKRLDGKQEAFLVALACSETPDGREAWTMQLLADRMVALGVVEGSLSDETVRRTLKKTRSSPGSKNNGVLLK
jgi:transposase